MKTHDFFYGSFFLIFEPLAPNRGFGRYLNKHGLNYLNIELSKTSALLSLWASLSTGLPLLWMVSPLCLRVSLLFLHLILLVPEVKGWITWHRNQWWTLACLCPPLLPPSVWLTGLPALPDQPSRSLPLGLCTASGSSAPVSLDISTRSQCSFFWLGGGWALSSYAFFYPCFIFCALCSCLFPVFSL